MPTHEELMRDEVLSLVRQSPFQPFEINLQNGDRVVIEHPENLAMDPGGNSRDPSPYFYAVAADLRIASTFGAVTSVAMVDERATPPLP